MGSRNITWDPPRPPYVWQMFPCPYVNSVYDINPAMGSLEAFHYRCATTEDLHMQEILDTIFIWKIRGTNQLLVRHSLGLLTLHPYRGHFAPIPQCYGLTVCRHVGDGLLPVRLFRVNCPPITVEVASTTSNITKRDGNWYVTMAWPMTQLPVIGSHVD